MNLSKWALKWGVNPEAIGELYRVLGAASHDIDPDRLGFSETAVQSRARLSASRQGFHLWRNNVGACEDSEGRQIRYGLANDSKRVCDTIKSSDLIGVRPVVIKPEHVGQVLGQFVAIEVKKPGWKLTPGDKRAQAQLRFITLVQAVGGYAKFITDERQL